MVLYKDIFTGDILVTDDHRLKLVDDFLYEVEGVMTEDGVDIVVKNKLISAGIKRKIYQHYVKDYVDRIVATLKQTAPDSVSEFKKKAKKHIKHIVDNFKDIDFFMGESASGEGMLITCVFKTEDDPPILTFWKHGLEEEDLRHLADFAIRWEH